MTTESHWEWWERMLKEHAAEGMKDAENGVFEPPYPGSQDPQDEDENAAYEEGWRARREQLGDAFKWQ